MSKLNCNICDKEVSPLGFMFCNTCHCLITCMDCFMISDNATLKLHGTYNHEVLPVSYESYQEIMKKASAPQKSDESKAFEAIAEEMYKEFSRKNPTVPCCTVSYCAHQCQQCHFSPKVCTCSKDKFMAAITREQVAAFVKQQPKKEEVKVVNYEETRAIREEMYAEYLKKRGPQRWVGTAAMCRGCGAGGSLSCSCPCNSCKYPKRSCVCEKIKFITAITQQQIEEFVNEKKAKKIAELEKKKQQAQKDLEDAEKQLNSM